MEYDDPDAEECARSEGIPWMATDELDIYENAETEEQLEAIHTAIDQRCSELNELDHARLKRLEYEPEAIQAIFDRVGLPLDHLDA